MALEGGGFADKFGNSYEEFWVAEQLLRLVEEEITSVTVEPLGEDETGVDLIVEKSNGSREFHQCKSSHNNSDVWTLSSLEISGVLIKAFNQIQRTDCTFKVVSPLSFTQLSQLSLSAKNTTSNPQDFIEHQVDQSGKRRKLFEDLCHKLGLNINVEIDIAKAIQFLKNFEVIAFPANSESQRNIIGKIDKNFSSNSNNIVDYLKNYPTDNNLRSSITSFQLLESMKGQGFNQRIYENDTRLFPIIERVNQAFRDSITPFLIEGSLIERSEMANCIDSIDNYPITLIKAEAGMGKSAFLLQLCDEMQKKGHICLPIRLDRNRPKKNADAFGDDLGFSHSPVFSLNKFAGAKKAIIILDQLDAIRWTASHSSSALQVCQQIAYQVIQLRKDNYDISLVLACRDFDLNEDIQLQSWISSLNNKVAHITIKELSVVEVKKLLSPYENYDSLSPVKQTILKIPIWLSFYIQLIKNDQGSLNFNSKSDLISLYWVDRLKQLNNAINDLSSANTIIDDFIEKASREMQFSISINALCSHNPNVLEAIISVGIFNKTGNQVSFQHQALFDYHLGKRLFDIARQSSDDFLKEIGSKSEQTLIRREHIKYALKLLSQSRQSVFCENISALFDSSEIRFHVKYLAINMVGEIKVIKTPMRNLITSLINNEELSQPFIDHACFGHSQLVTVLSEKNIISRWLNGSDSEIGLAIRLLSSIADKAPDIVLKEIEPFIGISEEWNNRCYSALSWNIQNDSEKMFEVRKKLLQLGCAVNYIDWNELAKSYPRKAIDLIQLILEGYKEELTDSSLDIKESEESVKHLHRKVWREGQIEDLESISEALPYDVLKELMLQVFEIINSSINESSYTRIWLYSARHSFNEHRDSLVRGVLGIFFEAGKQYTDKPDELFNLLTLYLTNKHPVVEHIIANLLLNLPIGYSDQIIKWLLDNPTTRLACGNDYEEPRWVLAGKLIDKFSPYCEDEIFNCLEIVISGIGLSKDLESIEYALEMRRKFGNFWTSYWGEAQYFLLNKLDDNRISKKSIDLYNVLQRRFKGCSDTYFYSYDSSYGGAVVSPIPQANKLSDRAWTKLILTNEERFSTWKMKPLDRGNITESSIRAFSNSLSTAVKNEPERFAKLSLTLPKNINEKFIENIYYGLADNNSSNLAEDFKESWQPCLLDLRYKVIRHFEGFDESQALTRLLTDTPKIIDHPDMLDKLIDIALHSSNPNNNKLNVYDPQEGEGAEHTTAESLMQNSINCYRGIAYGGIAKIFWDNEEYARDNLSLIDSAINDPHPAVKIVAVRLLTPFLNYDINYALQRFLDLCKSDLRMSCAYESYNFFNSAFIDKFKDQYIDLVRLMLTSEYEEVRRQAGTQIFARYFFNDLFAKEIFSVLMADESVKLGVAQVLVQLLTTDDYAEQEHKLVEVYRSLLNDDSQKVRGNLLSCIREKNFWNKGITEELVDIYMNSQVVNKKLYHLFYALENHVLCLSDFKSMLLQLFIEIATASLSDETKQIVYSEMDKLTKILQRIYDEAVDDEDDVTLSLCLDVWDNLLKSDSYEVKRATRYIENGLLS
ncbi:hypothetical protein QL898_12320 [Psychrobacter sp. APC 3279]|uniref:hypothetical protein n=4 Tax=Bacteria TaxID=2 RepID=UPI0025B51148|nr:hypothetical protein [Psychrobacter sp. APC 3279]MDN3442418.1 hypothetical protein [Psychrobacter sp. APC 3279]